MTQPVHLHNREYEFYDFCGLLFSQYQHWRNFSRKSSVTMGVAGTFQVGEGGRAGDPAPRLPPPHTPIAHFQGDFAEKIQDRTGPFPKSAAKLHHLPPHGQGPETKQNRHHKQKTPSCLISLDKATIGTNLTPSSQRGGNKSRGRRGSRGHPSSGVALARTQCHILAVTYVWMGGCFGSECDAFVQDTLVDRSDRRKQNTNRNGERADRDLS
jgi:hypothetical protein